MKGKIIDKEKLIVECPACGIQWSPNLSEGGKIPRGSMQCPNCKRGDKQ